MRASFPGVPVYDYHSRHQHIELFRNERLGLCLMLDGVLQSTEAGEHVYSEMFAHVPVCAAAYAVDVLVVGGADGYVLRELLKHPFVRPVLVDIDVSVVNLGKTWLAPGNWHSLHDERATVIVGDGFEYLRTTNQRFDVIIVDGPDPVGPGNAADTLYTRAFFDACKARLNLGGAVVVNGDMPFRNPDATRAIAGIMRDVFGKAGAYRVPAPDYQGGELAAVWGSVAPIDVPLRHAPSGLRHYSYHVHRAAFVLPPVWQELLK